MQLTKQCEIKIEIEKEGNFYIELNRKIFSRISQVSTNMTLCSKEGVELKKKTLFGENNKA